MLYSTMPVQFGIARLLKMITTVLVLGLVLLFGDSSQPLFAVLPASQGSPPTKTPVPLLRPGQTFRDCPECPEMVVIRAGRFTIGSPANEPGRFYGEDPQRQVSIHQFAAGKFDVTRGEWAAFVKATNRPTREGCRFSALSEADDAKGSWQNLAFTQDDRHPVVRVTWNDAQDYIQWLSQRTGHHYRLLTEAEWEYAARAGTTTPFPWGPTATLSMRTMAPKSAAVGLPSRKNA